MSERKKQLAKAVTIGTGAAAVDLVATTGWMHRELTHNAWQLPRPLRLVARAAIWQGPGIIPRAWAATHRTHHDYADQPGDPHSPVLEGRWGLYKLWVKNPFKYRAEAKASLARPPAADLQPDRLDHALFDNPKLGLIANFAGHVMLNKMVKNPAYMGAVSFAVEKLIYLSGGNSVNAIGHGGRNLPRAITRGVIEPHADGSYGADSLIVGSFTFGEGMQKYHHENPGSVYFGPAEQLSPAKRLLRDPVGAVALKMIKYGLASNPEQPQTPFTIAAADIPSGPNPAA